MKLKIKFIGMKSEILLAFGIFIFIIAGILFLSAQEFPEIEGISSPEFTYSGEGVELINDELSCQTGFEKCTIQITKGDFTTTIEATQGVKFDPVSGRVSIAESGAEFSINGNEFKNIDSGEIILDQTNGKITNANFLTDGGTYNLGGFSFKATGKVDFDLDKASLILPHNSVLEDFDNELFFKKFNEGLNVEGENLEISEDLFSKIFGGPSERFKRFSGEIGFGQAEERVIVEGESAWKKNPDKYFLFVPEGETVSFPDAGIDIETELKKTFINFGGHEETISNLGDKGLGFRKSDFIIPTGDLLQDYISLGKDEIYINSWLDSEEYGSNGITLTLKENSNYAGFYPKTNGHLSLLLEEGTAFLSNGEIDIEKEKSIFSIEDDGDEFKNWPEEERTLFNPGGGKSGTTPVGFNLLMKNKNILSLPNPEFYESAAEKGLMPTQLIFASYSLDYPVFYMDKSKSISEFKSDASNQRGFVTLSEANKKRSEIATYYYNTLFEE